MKNKAKKLLLFLTLSAALLLSACGVSVEVADTPVTPPPADGSSFAIHFIDVGQADSTLILCDGEAMLIDGGNVDDANIIYTYLKKQGIEKLDVVIGTHPHEDHMGGLPGAFHAAEVELALCPVDEWDTKFFDKFLDALEIHDTELMIPEPGDGFMLGSARVTVLGPQDDYEEPNDMSIAVRVVYGETSFLFTGDAEAEAEEDMLRSGEVLSSTLLHVGHHGSSTSSIPAFVQAVDPSYAVISCGKDNSYGHPHDEVVELLSHMGIVSYRTDELGDIICVSDGKTLTFTTGNGAATAGNVPEGNASAGSGITYIGNRNSEKFHLSSCSNLPAAENQVFFESREEALSAGYEPCGGCNP